MIYLRYKAEPARNHEEYGKRKTAIVHVYIDSPNAGDAKYKAEPIQAEQRLSFVDLLHEEVLEEPNGASPSDALLLSHFRLAQKHGVYFHLEVLEDIS